MHKSASVPGEARNTWFRCQALLAGPGLRHATKSKKLRTKVLQEQNQSSAKWDDGRMNYTYEQLPKRQGIFMTERKRMKVPLICLLGTQANPFKFFLIFVDFFIQLRRTHAHVGYSLEWKGSRSGGYWMRLLFPISLSSSCICVRGQRRGNCTEPLSCISTWGYGMAIQYHPRGHDGECDWRTVFSGFNSSGMLFILLLQG